MPGLTLRNNTSPKIAKSRISEENIRVFQKKIWRYYHEHGRDMLWRRTRNPYHIFISEVMLQQTQVSRVEEKYRIFLKKFPNFKSLANASLPEVLLVWQGLGYNRRARFLREAAWVVIHDYRGRLPQDPEKLAQLPGIGEATAGSIAAFAFDVPTIFIETNIRRVFINEFFQKDKDIHDDQIRELVSRSLPNKNYREWYYALMDYGVYLAQTLPKNPNQRSIHYHKQSSFKGSKREARGAILRLLLKDAMKTVKSIQRQSNLNPRLVQEALSELEQEGMVFKTRKGYQLRNT